MRQSLWLHSMIKTKNPWSNWKHLTKISHSSYVEVAIKNHKQIIKLMVTKQSILQTHLALPTLHQETIPTLPSTQMWVTRPMLLLHQETIPTPPSTQMWVTRPMLLLHQETIPTQPKTEMKATQSMLHKMWANQATPQETKLVQVFSLRVCQTWDSSWKTLERHQPWPTISLC